MFKNLLCLIIIFFANCVSADELIIEPDAGRAPLLAAMNQATSSIDLVMYGLTDEAFIHALISAKNHGKVVRVILEPEPYKSEGENIQTSGQLKLAHVNLQLPNKKFKLTHQKTFILDQRRAIIMTFNLTHSAFKNQRNFALILDDPLTVGEIEKVFSADLNQQAITTKNPNLIWSPDNSREKILTLIKQAKSTIEIYAQNISDYQTIGALAQAARRGVQVKVLTSLEPEKSFSRKLAYLARAGVLVRDDQKIIIHAKVIILDHRTAVIGSINLTDASMDKNRELSIISSDPKIVNKLLHTFEQDW